MYGNGGLKCWPKEYVLNMRTHENADPNNRTCTSRFLLGCKIHTNE